MVKRQALTGTEGVVMHKDDLKSFRKKIKEVFHKVRIMNDQLNEGSYQKLEGDELNAIIEQMDSNV